MQSTTSPVPTTPSSSVVTLSLIHLGHGPDILAIPRNLAISLLHAAGITTIAAQLRHFSSHPQEALCLITAFQPQNA